MDPYTQYYANQSGGGEIGPLYKASVRVQNGHSIWSFFRFFRFVKPLLASEAKAVGRKALKSGSNITDLIEREPDRKVGYILRTRFGEAKDNLEQKIRNMTGSGLRLKRKRDYKNLILNRNVGEWRIYFPLNYGVLKVGSWYNSYTWHSYSCLKVTPSHISP